MMTSRSFSAPTPRSLASSPALRRCSHSALATFASALASASSAPSCSTRGSRASRTALEDASSERRPVISFSNWSLAAANSRSAFRIFSSANANAGLSRSISKLASVTADFADSTSVLARARSAARWLAWSSSLAARALVSASSALVSAAAVLAAATSSRVTRNCSLDASFSALVRARSACSRFASSPTRAFSFSCSAAWYRADSSCATVEVSSPRSRPCSSAAVALSARSLATCSLASAAARMDPDACSCRSLCAVVTLASSSRRGASSVCSALDFSARCASDLRADSSCRRLSSAAFAAADSRFAAAASCAADACASARAASSDCAMESRSRLASSASPSAFSRSAWDSALALATAASTSPMVPRMVRISALARWEKSLATAICAL